MVVVVVIRAGAGDGDGAFAMRATRFLVGARSAGAESSFAETGK
jgi:hypothetical protein